jgi:threonyl-tRNA synthetase
MKILSIHADFIEWEAKKKAFKGAEEGIQEGPHRVENCLVIFTAFEKMDEADVKVVVDKYVQQITNIAQQVNASNIVLYPYAHLSSNLGNPKLAQQSMQDAEKKLRDIGKYQVSRAPFGWYKAFDVKCKGHPLSELSREFSVDESYDGVKGRTKAESDSKVSEGMQVEEKEITKEEVKNLLQQISRSRLDTTKLKDNDHRIIGRDLDWWSFNDAAPGMVFWHHKGLIIRNKLSEYWREVHTKNNYQEISTPQVMDKKLWQISGHWDKYKENNFVTKYEKRDFLVKPMNCPGGMLVYKTSSKSYKDLPLRVGELGVVHRVELSGVLSGLFRLIQFTQDDSHLFCTEDQVEDEISNAIDIINEIYARFGLKFDHVELSTRPEKRIGDDAVWDLSEQALENVLKRKEMKYTINAGDGAFYGPKIDFHLTDSLKRTWQCSTIQMDMSMPERFEAEYISKEGLAKRPIMLHKAVYGAIERFIGILTEHLNGKLPLWLNPVQIKVLTITDDQVEYAKEVVGKFQAAGFRVELDDRTETMGKKVRDAQIEKVNYTITIGEKEVEKKNIAVRNRVGENKFDVDLNEFIADLADEVKSRVIK